MITFWIAVWSNMKPESPGEVGTREGWSDWLSQQVAEEGQEKMSTAKKN